MDEWSIGLVRAREIVSLQRCTMPYIEVQQGCNRHMRYRGATEVQQRCNRGATEVQQSNRGAPEGQQRCNRGATENLAVGVCGEYAAVREEAVALLAEGPACSNQYVRIRQHTSAYAARQHTSEYVSIRSCSLVDRRSSL